MTGSVQKCLRDGAVFCQAFLPRNCVVKVNDEIAVQQKWKSTPWFLLGAQRLETMLNDV